MAYIIDPYATNHELFRLFLHGMKTRWDYVKTNKLLKRTNCTRQIFNVAKWQQHPVLIRRKRISLFNISLKV